MSFFIKTRFCMKKRTARRSKAFFVVSCLLFLVVPAFAQNVVSGKVVTEKGEPVAGATVSLKNRKASTRTDEQGAFRFANISGSNLALVVTHIGFDRKEVIY